MADIVETFLKAKSDGIVTSKELQEELKNFTVEDWKKLSSTHGGTNAMVNDVWVEEKDNEFLVHNSELDIRSRDILTGVGSFLRGALLTAAGTGIGHMALKSRLGGWGMLAGAGVGFLSGYIWHRHSMAPIEEIKNTANPLHVPKDILKQEQTAMLNAGSMSELSKAMLAKSYQRTSLELLKA